MMKLIVMTVMIIANISSNSKASLDSFSPAIANSILFEDTTRNSDKSCQRPCKFNVKPKRCYYNFKIEPNYFENKPAISINGIIPGPPINVCLNDIIVVEVQNKVPDQDIAVHWNGIEQKGTPYMDGVPMVSQCPISYGQTYKYAFIASLPGTFFYHADSVSHQSDGVYGSLIVNQPQPLEPHSNLYDYDRSVEHTLLIAARFPRLMTASLEAPDHRPSTLLINGDEDNYKLFMLPGFAYRLRLVNAVAIECPVIISVDKHEMTVIATDGKPVKPVTATKVKLYPGERMDVVVRTQTESGGYFIRASGDRGACAGLSASAMFLSTGFNYTTMLHDKIKTKTVPDTNQEAVYGQMLESLFDVPNRSEFRPVYLGIDKNVLRFKDTDNDFRYISDAVAKKPFYPAALSLQENENGAVQINTKNFLYPGAPILLKPYRADHRCLVGEEDEVADPQCLQVLEASVGEVLEIALVNEGFGSNDSYTFHLHGFGMQVVASGHKPDDTPISREEFLTLDTEGIIKRNRQNPVIKNSVTVPNKGYVIVRVVIDYAGSWILECRSCSFTLPTAVLINVHQTIPKAILEALPKCGSFKPPDVLLT